jgi:hypothetical protein
MSYELSALSYEPLLLVAQSSWLAAFSICTCHYQFNYGYPVQEEG